MILYVWTRRNPDEQTTLFVLKVQAFYLPWALLVFKVLIGNSVMLEILGIVAGHIYYFLHYIAPQTYGVTLIKTPAILIEYFHGPGARGAGAPRAAGRGWGQGNVLGAR